MKVALLIAGDEVVEVVKVGLCFRVADEELVIVGSCVAFQDGVVVVDLGEGISRPEDGSVATVVESLAVLGGCEAGEGDREGQED